MSSEMFSFTGGTILRPKTVLCDRLDGGHLIVNPPRPVWERSCLSAHELIRWSLLVAATGKAMLEVLPVLAGGCLNYWEAGNWALNDLAEPVGPKSVEENRQVHMHIFGRSRASRDSDWRWGESPKFPDFVHSGQWASRFSPLLELETRQIARRVAILLETSFYIPGLSEEGP
jgi:hypothetical protein